AVSLEPGQADGGTVAGRRAVRRRSRSVPDKLADIAHPADGDPEPGVADIRVPMDIVHWQGLSRAPLVRFGEVIGGEWTMDLRRNTGLGLGRSFGQP
ncbi:MAG: hypothetical protein QOG75_7051, partial [Mycobacterium sp.]|nr:hypothetical protein [Mycobacterium sp.]